MMQQLYCLLHMLGNVTRIWRSTRGVLSCPGDHGRNYYKLNYLFKTGLQSNRVNANQRTAKRYIRVMNRGVSTKYSLYVYMFLCFVFRCDQMSLYQTHDHDEHANTGTLRQIVEPFQYECCLDRIPHRPISGRYLPKCQKDCLLCSGCRQITCHWSPFRKQNQQH